MDKWSMYDQDECTVLGCHSPKEPLGSYCKKHNTAEKREDERITKANDYFELH